MLSHWRDCEEWKKEGLTLTTSSNEAAKLFDVAVNQYVGLYENEQFGGFEGTFAGIKKADPEFVMGHVVHNALQLISMSTKPSKDPVLQQRLIDMNHLANKRCLTEREQLHINAVTHLEKGFLDKACCTWEKILLDHPRDLLAIKLAQDGYFHLGQSAKMRNCIARILPHWNTSMPHYGYLLGMYSFGLCETYDYEQAEKLARKGLELNRKDSWSMHSLVHVFEMTGRTNDGIELLQSTSDSWQGLLSCHLNWHSAVFHVENGDFTNALDVFDKKICASIQKTQSAFNISDASSLLYRLSLEGFELGNRWETICSASQHHINDNLSTFYDIHYLLSFLGAQQKKLVAEFFRSSTSYASSGMSPNQVTMRNIGLCMIEAFIKYNEGKFEETVEKLLPLRDAVIDRCLSGSHAQKDVFMLMLIRAALKSSDFQHNVLARRLIAERHAFRECTAMKSRLLNICESHKLKIEGVMC